MSQGTEELIGAIGPGFARIFDESPPPTNGRQREV